MPHVYLGAVDVNRESVQLAQNIMIRLVLCDKPTSRKTA